MPEDSQAGNSGRTTADPGMCQGAERPHPLKPAVLASMAKAESKMKHAWAGAQHPGLILDKPLKADRMRALSAFSPLTPPNFATAQLGG